MNLTALSQHPTSGLLLDPLPVQIEPRVDSGIVRGVALVTSRNNASEFAIDDAWSTRVSCTAAGFAATSCAERVRRHHCVDLRETSGTGFLIDHLQFRRF